MVSNQINFTNLDRLDFGKGDGLLPAVVQHAGRDAVLMLGYMNREALVATLARRRVVFFSRSRGRLWEKGETSGHYLQLEDIRTDCDRDALLVRAWPQGPVCHSGAGSCFGAETEIEGDSLSFLSTLESVIDERITTRPEGSYTAKLLAAGWTRIAQKVGEEGLEVALATVDGSDADVVDESADLLYHLLVLLRSRGLKLERVLKELESRHVGRTQA
ncbi:MAG TPA: bifunctional phosphoribosyl-AMP cyclohydrolase/phosphoribosyl-ATP diphosphatase HisIE [Steroidobacteraceae bacterium]|nr:bifunctional phosphoribosyl-AMP cyclohydrolase/phosphoribosyl-ATP diphosphatase HisIE [Steroidobacteraceae bacterium]